MKRNSHQHPLPTPPPPDFSSPASSSSTGKAKMWEDTEPDAGFDELLAVMGYQVKASDMSQVAEKLEQLEQVMGDAQKDGASQLGPDTVYYNPSDMNSWIETVLSEINPADGAPNQFQSASDYDLTAIPGKALYPQSPPGSPNKRFRSNSGSSSSIIWDGPPQSVVGDSTRQMVVVDSQENGVRIVHTLLACAEAVQQKNLNLAEALVKQIGFLAVSQPGPMRKVATYFAEGLARRIYGLFPQNQTDPGFSDLLQLHFYETCPYLKFAHFTANQAILEAFTGKQSVHVIDFSLQQGMQWPALIQALALRPGGPPKFRLTGIGPPSSDNIDRLKDVGRNLASLANTVNVPFEFTGLIANSLVELQAPIFDIREGEAVAINSIFELHPLLARRGGIEQVLSVVKEMKPEVVTVAEQEGNHNGPSFVARFHESLHYYASLFDSLEVGGDSSVVGDSQNKVMSEIYLGRQICNVVATEGVDRVERHETLAQWRIRLGEAGFESVHLGSNAFKQASLLLALFNGGGGYRVEEDNGSLTLGWHTRQLIAVSAWKPCQN